MTNQLTTRLGIPNQSATRHDGTPPSSCGNATLRDRVRRNSHPLCHEGAGPPTPRSCPRRSPSILLEQVKKALQHGDHVVWKRIVVEVHEIIANLGNLF